MARIKRGVTRHRRHAAVLARTAGFRGTRHSLYKRAKESLVKALSHAYRHRRERKGDFRSLWVVRINAAAREHGITYSQLMHGLKMAGILLDRKILADMAVRDKDGFSQLAFSAREQLGSP